MPMRQRLAVATVASLVALGASACTDDGPGPAGGALGRAVGRRGLSAAVVEARVRPLLERELAAPADELSCTGLTAASATADPAATCRAVVEGRRVDVAVSAPGGDPTGELAITLGEPEDPSATAPTGEPEPPGSTSPSTSVVDGRTVPVVAPDALAGRLAASLGEEVGEAAPPVTCAEPLVGVVGRTGRCVVEEGAERYDVAVRVTGVDGLDVTFAYEVADEPSR